MAQGQFFCQSIIFRAISFSSILITPPEGVNNPQIKLMRVDLPEPDFPTKPTASPLSINKLRLSIIIFIFIYLKLIFSNSILRLKI